MIKNVKVLDGGIWRVFNKACFLKTVKIKVLVKVKVFPQYGESIYSLST